MSRKFDEKEVALIFQQATELDVPVEGQRETYSPSDLRGGLDLQELKEIAAQVGVDPTRVDQAARSLMIRPRPSPVSMFLGRSTDIEMESEFDVSLRLSDEIRGDLLREIRTVTARQGVTEGQSGSFEWKAEGHLFRRYVTISPSSAGSRLTVTGRFKNAQRWAAAVGSYFAVVAMASVLAVFTAGGGRKWFGYGGSRADLRGRRDHDSASDLRSYGCPRIPQVVTTCDSAQNVTCLGAASG